MKNYITVSGRTFTSDQIKGGNMYLAMNLLSSALEASTITAEVETTDTSILNFEINTPLEYFHKERRVAIFYLQDVKRIGPKAYELSATSSLGLLAKDLHYGGIYTGQRLDATLHQLMGTVPYAIKTSLRSIKLYGWLPVAAKRDNLAQILFAVGAIVKDDLNGVVRIEPLWDGVSQNMPKDNMYLDSGVDYSGKITQVSVTEHQYIEGTEEVQLFQGTTLDDEIITFDEPMHHLVAEGFSILESGANYARLSAGAGLLTGRKYIHNTRQVSKSVSSAAEPNVKQVTDATLVSLTSSEAVASRLANLYQHRETINASVVYQGEQPGDLVSTYHPFDKKTVTAALQSADITISGTLKAQVLSLVGFVPLAPEVDYLDHMEVLTGSGSWIVPANVDSVLAVLIGGGQGGSSGLPGGDIPDAPAYYNTWYEWPLNYYDRGYYAQEGAPGGEAGDPGNGGNVLIVSMAVTPGQTLSYSAGSGGKGGMYDGANKVSGSAGGNSTFAGHTSASGTIIPGGWVEETNQTILARTGTKGYAGGKGSGRKPVNMEPSANPEWEELPGNTIEVDGIVYTPGADQWDDKVSAGGGSALALYGSFSAGAWGGHGGGAAYKANGYPGFPATGDTENNAEVYASSYSASCRPPRGGNGASALDPPAATQYGHGGAGGNGGGGAGSGGYGGAMNVVREGGDAVHESDRLTVTPPEKAIGGAGSNGGDGAPGCVILYYSTHSEMTGGGLIEANTKYFQDRLGRQVLV